MYEPTVLVSTVPLEVTVSPPSDVAPASVYVAPSSTVAGLSPSTVRTGKTVSGGVGVSSEMLSARTMPASINNCSMIESSRSILDLVVAGVSESSPSSISSRDLIKKLLLSTN